MVVRLLLVLSKYCPFVYFIFILPLHDVGTGILFVEIIAASIVWHNNFHDLISFQIVVRSQIPLLIGIKNSFGRRRQSGYNWFMNIYIILCLVPAGFLVGSFFVQDNISIQVLMLCLFAIIFAFSLFIIGHVRTAFKLK